MIANQLPLLKRELWEHRSIYVTPLVVALLITLVSVTGQVTISAYDQIVDVAILGATNMGPEQRAAIIATLMAGVAGLFALAMWILIVFYSLDALYAERKDRSILFWRSMPCTDAETVLSKVLTALVVIPLITFAVVAITQLIVLTCASVWVAVRGGSAWQLIWAAAPFTEVWAVTLSIALAMPLWLSPFIGWFLFVSAFARRSPLLVAFLPILVLPLLERSLVGTTVFTDAFFVRSVEIPLFSGLHGGKFLLSEADGQFSFNLLSQLDLGRFLTTPGLWLGLVVCALFATAAIYLRRYRDDS